MKILFVLYYNILTNRGYDRILSAVDIVIFEWLRLMSSSSGNPALVAPSPAVCAGSHDIPSPMVSEYRQIVFSNEALRVALFELERRQKIKPPAGVIVACQLAKDHGKRAKLTFHDALLDEQHDVEVDENNLAAALIHYCIKGHIPIPREADKCLKLVDGRISLNFSLFQNGGEVQRSNVKAHS